MENDMPTSAAMENTPSLKDQTEGAMVPTIHVSFLQYIYILLHQSKIVEVTLCGAEATAGAYLLGSAALRWCEPLTFVCYF